MLSDAHRFKLENAYLEQVRSGIFNPKLKLAMDFASGVDPDFVGSLRQRAVDFHSSDDEAAIKNRAPDPLPMWDGDSISNSPSVASYIAQNIPGISEGLQTAKEALGAGLSYDSVKNFAGTVDPTAYLARAAGARDSDTLSHGLIYDIGAGLAGTAPVPPKIDLRDNALEDIPARVANFIPGVGSVTSALFDTNAGGLEDTAGSLTRLIGTGALGSAGAAGWLGGASPALVTGAGIAARLAPTIETQAQGGDIKDVGSTALTMELAGGIGRGLAPQTFAGAAGTEALANLGPGLYQAGIQDPDLAQRIASNAVGLGDRDLTDDEKAKSAAILQGALINATVGAAGGIMAHAGERNAKLAAAGYTPEQAAAHAPDLAAAQVALDKLTPEERDAKLAAAESQASDASGNPLAVNQAAADRDRLIRMATKQKAEATGDDNAALTADEYKSALLSHIAGKDQLYSPPSKIVSAVKGLFTSAPPEEQHFEGEEAPPPPLQYNSKFAEDRGDDPALYAIGHDITKQADAARAAGDLAKADALEQKGNQLKQIAIRPINGPETLSKAQFRQALTDTTEGHLDPIAAHSALGVAHLEDQADAEARGKTPTEIDAQIAYEKQKAEDNKAALDYWTQVLPEQKARQKNIAAELSQTLKDLQAEKENITIRSDKGASLGHAQAEKLTARAYDLMDQLDEIQRQHPDKNADHALATLSLLHEVRADAEGESQRALDARNKAKDRVDRLVKEQSRLAQSDDSKEPNRRQDASLVADEHAAAVRDLDAAEKGFHAAEQERIAKSGDLQKSLADVQETYNAMRARQADENETAAREASNVVSEHYKGLKEGAKDIYAKEKETNRENQRIGNKAIPAMLEKLKARQERVGMMEDQARTKATGRDLLSKAVKTISNAGGKEMAKTTADYLVKKNEIVAPLSSYTPEELTGQKLDIENRRIENTKNRLTLEGEQKQIETDLKEAAKKRGTLNASQRGIPAREAKVDPTNADLKAGLESAADILSKEVDQHSARLDEVRQKLAAVHTEAKLIDEDARRIGAIDFENPNYAAYRRTVIENLVHNGHANTLAQADAMVRSVERSANSRELDRMFDEHSIAPSRTESGIRDLYKDAGVGPGGGDAGDVAARSTAIQDILSRRQDDIDRIIRVATFGPTGKLAKAIDKALSIAAAGTNLFGNTSARALHYEHSGEPGTPAFSRVMDLHRDAEEKVYMIKNALRSIMFHELNPELGRVASAKREAARIFSINPMTATERAFINSHGTNLLRDLGTGDVENIKKELKAFDKKTNGGEGKIKDIDNARLVHLATGWSRTAPAAAKGLKAVQVALRDGYFPRNLSDTIYEMLSKKDADGGHEYGKKIAKEIAKAGARESPDFGDHVNSGAAIEEHPRYQQIFGALMDAIVDPDNEGAKGATRAAAAKALLEQMNLTSRSSEAKSAAQLSALSEAPATMEREINFPEWIVNDKGEHIPVVSRDLENIIFKYTGDVGRVIASRATYGYGDKEGLPNRLADAMVGVKPGSKQEAQAIALYREIALGKKNAETGVDTPYLGRISTFVQGEENIPRAFKTAFNSFLNVKKPLMVSGSLFSNLLSFSRLLTDARGWDSHIALIPGLRKFTSEKFIADMVANNIESHGQMVQDIARNRAENGTNGPSARALEEFYTGLASSLAQQKEARSGEELSNPNASKAEHVTEAIGGVIGKVSLVDWINNYINHVSTISARAAAKALSEDLSSKHAPTRESAAFDLEHLYGLTEINRIKERGLTEEDYAVAARNSRARSNGVDRSSLETPSILRSWITRKLFSLQSVAMIQGANFAIDIERLRASGVPDALANGDIATALKDPALRKTAMVGFGLILAGLYREGLKTWTKRSEPTDDALTNLALTTLNEYGYVGGLPETIAYAKRLEGSGSKGVLDWALGGAPVETGGITDIANAVEVMAGSKTKDKAAREAVPLWRNAREAFDGTWSPDNITKLAKEYEREGRRLRRTGDHVPLLDGFAEIFDNIERGKRLARMKKLYGEADDSGE